MDIRTYQLGMLKNALLNTIGDHVTKKKVIKQIIVVIDETPDLNIIDKGQKVMIELIDLGFKSIHHYAFMHSLVRLVYISNLPISQKEITGKKFVNGIYIEYE